MRKKWGKVVAMVLVCGGCLTACGTAKQENHSVVPTITTTNIKEKKDNPEKLKNIKVKLKNLDT